MKHRGGVLIASGHRLAGTPDPPDPPGGDVRTPPGSIDPTGTTNVSADLQAWIDAQPDNVTFDFTGKIYRCDQQLNLWSRNDLTILAGKIQTDDPTGDGSPLSAPSSQSRSRSHWDLRYSDNITFIGHEVRGPNFNGGPNGGYVLELEAQMGFNMLACTNIEFDSCTITDVYGDWFYVGMDNVFATWSDGINMHDGVYARNGRQGLAVVAGRNVIFQNNNCTEMARAFVDLEPNGQTLFGCDNVLIDNNIVGEHGLTFIGAGGTGPVDNVTVSNNTLIGNAMGILCYGQNGSRANWTIHNNVSDFPTSGGGGVFMEFNFAHNITVTNNTQPSDGVHNPMALAYFNQCIGVTCQGNTVANCTSVLFYNVGQYMKNCGNRLTATGPFDHPEVCVTGFGTPAQYAGLTAWYDAFQATDADLAPVSSMTDFSGNGRHLVSSGSARPTFRHNIAGRQKRCYQFDGVDDFVGNNIPLSNFISNSAYTIFAVFEPMTIGAAADNDAVWSDSAGVHGIYMRSTPDAYAYNVDSGGAGTVTQSLTLGKRTLLMMRHEGGNLYVAKDGGAETLVASGNTTTLAGLIRIGANYLGNQFSNILLHEVNVYNVALTTAQILDRTNRLYIDWQVAFVYGAQDSFNRPDSQYPEGLGTSDSGHVWETRAPLFSYWGVVSNKAQLIVGNSIAGENNVFIDTGLSDCTISCDVDMALRNGITYRYTRANWSLFWAGGGGYAYLLKIVDDSYDYGIGTLVSGLVSSGIHTIKVVLLGASVKCYVGTTLVFDVTNTHNVNATQHGLRVLTSEQSPSTPVFDNFLVVP